MEKTSKTVLRLPTTTGGQLRQSIYDRLLCKNWSSIKVTNLLLLLYSVHQK
jgi:hypothetical protein